MNKVVILLLLVSLPACDEGGIPATYEECVWEASKRNTNKAVYKAQTVCEWSFPNHPDVIRRKKNR